MFEHHTTVFQQGWALRDVAWASDSRHCLTISRNGDLWLWDAQRGVGRQLVATPTRLWDAALAADRTTAVALVEAAAVGDRPGMTVQAAIDLLTGHVALQPAAVGARCLALRPDSAELWQGGDAGVVPGNGIAPLALPAGDTPLALRFAPDGAALLVLGGAGATVWDAATGDRLADLIADAGALVPPACTFIEATCAAWSADGARLALGVAAVSGRPFDQVWVVERGSWRRAGGAAPYDVSGVALSADGAHVAATGLQQPVCRVWRVRDGADLWHTAAAPGTPVAWSPDGDWLLTGAPAPGFLHVWRRRA